MIKRICPENFQRYGRIIEYPHKNSQRKNKNLFRIVLRENKSPGWRIAYLVVREKGINRLERHPHTFESFEPVKGRCLLYVADAQGPGKIACFYLDRPVILKKNIWHGLITLGRESEIKITENSKVKTQHWSLRFSLNHQP
jgi:ureidoglycolate hydrolase